MKISILSPVFDEQAYVGEMIESVQAQDHKDWELIFVDDGSSDGTVRVINRYAASDYRIKLVSQGIRMGKVAAFNRAHNESDGEVVVLLAGDDRIPQGSLRIRHDALAAVVSAPQHRVAAFFKIRTFSIANKFDGMVMPRGRAASRSGGSVTMNRALSDVVFPIDESLISEDIWLAWACLDLADMTIERMDVVLDYRIHDGNSNPRHRPFSEMTEFMHNRHKAWRALLECPRFNLKAETRGKLSSMCTTEELRYAGKTMSLLLDRSPFVDRMAMASMSSGTLFFLRSRFYKLFSGWRGQ